MPKGMADHIGEIYDFSISKEDIKEFWWHLDKVADGRVQFTLNVVLKED